MANVISWIGLAAEGEGRYGDAMKSFDESSSRYRKLAELEPAVAQWRYELSEALTFTGEVQAITGMRAEASASFARARTLIDLLAAQDPKNRQWEVTALGIRLKQVGLLLANGNVRAAAAILVETRAKLEVLFAAEPSSRAFAGLLAAALRFDSQMRLATQSPDAGDPVARAIKLGEAFNHETNAHDWIFGEYAQACILAGRIAFARADPDLARRDWNRALKVLGPAPENSNNWRLLDPAAQALALLGRAGDARPLIERLRRFGYHSIDPLADSILDSASE
jgi:tetratricopeptide (TPR) repeat protein